MNQSPPLILTLGKTYIINEDGKRQLWEPFRLHTTKEGRNGYMGVTSKGKLKLITNKKGILGESATNNSEPIYGPLRGYGLDNCTKCRKEGVANSYYFPGAYEDGYTTRPPICQQCSGPKRVRTTN